MNKYKMKKAGINAREGIERFSDNEKLYETCLYDFLNDDHYELLKKDIENKDAVSGFSNAHALKGIVGNLSMDNLYASVCKLVEELRAGSVEHADELFEMVTRDYNIVIDLLRETSN